jgi:hypothetical protein
VYSESENDMSSIREQIATHLASGKKTAKELYANLKDAENEKQVSNALYQMRKAGQIERDEDGRYTLAGKAIVMNKLSPAKKEKLKKAVAALTADTIGVEHQKNTPPALALRRTLENSITQTQNALDDYLSSLADQTVLVPLRTARDSARAALAAFDSKKEA